MRSPAAPANAVPSGPINRQANYQINWNHSNAAFRGAAAVRAGGVGHGASFGPLTGNTWYYLAATYDGETLRAYKDGVLITSNTAPSGPPNSDANSLKLGRAAAANQFFQGTVDEVRVYNRALSLAEIQSDMVTPVAPSANQAPNGVINTPASNVTITAGQSVNFTGTGSDPDNNTPLTFLWNFGSGSGW